MAFALFFGLAGVVLGSDGNFYGITAVGGTSNDGTIFKLTPAMPAWATAALALLLFPSRPRSCPARGDHQQNSLE